METLSIQNSNPAIGRISTLPLAQSKRRNNQSSASLAAFSLTMADRSWAVRLFNAQPRNFSGPSCGRRSTPKAYRGWTFLNRRVKGAWWPSRSSKPSSVGNGRGRFDSYPLRLFSAAGAFSLRRSVATALCRRFGSRPDRAGRLQFLALERW
ncbi:MAG: hypothetical protein QOH39_1540 [Verrucomicrobiota bacterium]